MSTKLNKTLTELMEAVQAGKTCPIDYTTYKAALTNQTKAVFSKSTKEKQSDFMLMDDYTFSDGLVAPLLVMGKLKKYRKTIKENAKKAKCARGKVFQHTEEGAETPSLCFLVATQGSNIKKEATAKTVFKPLKTALKKAYTFQFCEDFAAIDAQDEAEDKLDETEEDNAAADSKEDLLAALREMAPVLDKNLKIIVSKTGKQTLDDLPFFEETYALCQDFLAKQAEYGTLPGDLQKTKASVESFCTQFKHVLTKLQKQDVKENPKELSSQDFLQKGKNMVEDQKYWGDYAIVTPEGLKDEEYKHWFVLNIDKALKMSTEVLFSGVSELKKQGNQQMLLEKKIIEIKRFKSPMFDNDEKDTTKRTGNKELMELIRAGRSQNRPLGTQCFNFAYNLAKELAGSNHPLSYSTLDGNANANGTYAFFNTPEAQKVLVDKLQGEGRFKKAWEAINAGKLVYFCSENKTGAGHVATGAPTTELRFVKEINDYIGNVVQAGTSVGDALWAEKVWPGDDLLSVDIFVNKLPLKKKDKKDPIVFLAMYDKITQPVGKGQKSKKDFKAGSKEYMEAVNNARVVQSLLQNEGGEIAKTVGSTDGDAGNTTINAILKLQAQLKVQFPDNPGFQESGFIAPDDEVWKYLTAKAKPKVEDFLSEIEDYAQRDTHGSPPSNNHLAPQPEQTEKTKEPEPLKEQPKTEKTEEKPKEQTPANNDNAKPSQEPEKDTRSLKEQMDELKRVMSSGLKDMSDNAKTLKNASVIDQQVQKKADNLFAQKSMFEHLYAMCDPNLQASYSSVQKALINFDAFWNSLPNKVPYPQDPQTPQQPKINTSTGEKVAITKENAPQMVANIRQYRLKSSVGLNGANHPEDIAIVKALLEERGFEVADSSVKSVTEAIAKYQQKFSGLGSDSKVDAGGSCWFHLINGYSPRTKEKACIIEMYAPEAKAISTATGLNENIIKAIIGVESGGKASILADAADNSGAMGLMQITKGTWLGDAKLSDKELKKQFADMGNEADINKFIEKIRGSVQLFVKKNDDASIKEALKDLKEGKEKWRDDALEALKNNIYVNASLKTYSLKVVNWDDAELNVLMGALAFKSKAKSLGIDANNPENFIAIACAYNVGQEPVKDAIKLAKDNGEKNPNVDFLKKEYMVQCIAKYPGSYGHYLKDPSVANLPEGKVKAEKAALLKYEKEAKDYAKKAKEYESANQSVFGE